MKRGQACGYILEVVIEKLIRVNGYEVITVANNDDIIEEKKILKLKGRGGYHQFDSLGSFKITPPFMYPIRLFAEAKFYSKNHKVGIDLVRMGIGLLQDVNTNYFTVLTKKDKITRPKYDYHYAIFSTSGFTSEAQKLAIAHKICLVDFNGEKLKEIKLLIKNVVYKWVDEEKKKTGIVNEEKINLEKERIFEALKRFRENKPFLYDENKDTKMLMLGSKKYHDFTELYETIKNVGLYFTSTIGVMNLVLISENANDISVAFKKNHHHKVSIRWDGAVGFWIITPKAHNTKYEFKFSLPNVLVANWLSALEKIDNDIIVMSFIACFDENKPTLCTLTFEREEIINCICEANG